MTCDVLSVTLAKKGGEAKSTLVVVMLLLLLLLLLRFCCCCCAYLAGWPLRREMVQEGVLLPTLYKLT